MHKRLKLQKLMILVLSVIISIVLITTLVGRTQTIKVVVLKDNDINLSKTLDEQMDSFETKEISKRDYESLGGNYATSMDDLKNKHLQYKLDKGSLIPLSLLSEKSAAGEFATAMPENYTVYKIADAIGKLPLGTVAGDKINIALTAEIKVGDTDEKELVTGVLLRDVTIHSVDKADVYVKVTTQQYLELATGEKIGQFVLQLPGKKQVETCDNLEEEIEEEVQKLIDKEQEKDPDKEFDFEQMVQERLDEMDCTRDQDEAKNVTEKQLLDRIQMSQMDNGSEEDEDDKSDWTVGYDKDGNQYRVPPGVTVEFGSDDEESEDDEIIINE